MLQEKERLLTAKEASRLLGVSDARIRQLLLEGLISGHKVSNLVWLIPESEILRYQKDRRKPGRPPSSQI
jgi:excisionase family DNA binding protein